MTDDRMFFYKLDAKIDLLIQLLMTNSLRSRQELLESWQRTYKEGEYSDDNNP